MFDWRDAIWRAVKIAGGMLELERRAKLPRGAVIFSLRKRRKNIPVEIAIAVSLATDGEVRISDIVPHVVEAVRNELDREAGTEALAPTS